MIDSTQKLDKFPYTQTLLFLLLKKLKKRNLVIMDIGAYTGNYCIKLSQKYNRAIIHAIEPCPKNHKMLRGVTRHFTNIYAYRCAISNTTGKQTLYTISSQNNLKISSQSNSLYPSFIKEKKGVGKKKGYVLVNTFTLKDFCKKFKITEIDLLRINCEGSEYNIFENEADLDMFDNVQIVDIALHGKSEEFISEECEVKKRNINTFLKRKGFEIMYGEDISDKENLSAKHINQVWQKTKY